MTSDTFAKVNDAFSMQDYQTVHERLAANLRRLRIARHLSLSELARATAMSKATLSGIENARANPTVETLAALAAALRVPLADLLDEPPLGEIRVLRAAAAPDEAIRLLERLSPEGDVEIVELALPARTAQEERAKRGGSRAHVYVLHGKLIAGPVERITELAPGDFASFPADVPHVYEAVRQPVRALVVSA